MAWLLGFPWAGGVSAARSERLSVVEDGLDEDFACGSFTLNGSLRNAA
jgi:hypothetical protein